MKKGEINMTERVTIREKSVAPAAFNTSLIHPGNMTIVVEELINAMVLNDYAIQTPNGYLLKGDIENSVYADGLNRIFKAANEADVLKHDNLHHLSEEDSFSEASETEIILLKRFTDKRNKLLRSHSFVKSKELSSTLGYDKDSNIARILKAKRDKLEILYVSHLGAVFYPLMQFNTSAEIYPELIAALPKLNQSRSGWDVCFWLTDERTVMIDKAVPSDEQIQALSSIDEIAKLGEKAHEQSSYVTSTPLKLLQDGLGGVFQVFCQDLINPDERIIPEKRVVI